jgi:hypothetical protein
VPLLTLRAQHPDLPQDHPDNYDPQGTNRWPEGQAAFREVNERYQREMTRISHRLLEVFALGFGLQPTALNHMFEPSHTSFLRLNYYVSGCWVGLMAPTHGSVSLHALQPSTHAIFEPQLCLPAAYAAHHSSTLRPGCGPTLALPPCNAVGAVDC